MEDTIVEPESYLSRQIVGHRVTSHIDRSLVGIRIDRSQNEAVSQDLVFRTTDVDDPFEVSPSYLKFWLVPHDSA